MFCLRKWIRDNRATSCLLVAIVFLQLFAQAHLHLRHADDSQSSGHEHVVDFHLLATDHADNHDPHDNAHEIKSTPVIIVKKILDRDTVYILSACLLILLPILVQIVSLQNPLRFYILKGPPFYHLSPPLRAPPAI